MNSPVSDKPAHARRVWFIIVCVVVAVAVTIGVRLLTTSTAPAAPAAVVDVSITGAFPNFSFSPAVITITAGTTVRWTNNTASPHTSTSNPGSTDPWDSGTLLSGGTYSRIFLIASAYPYHCEFHPEMHGTIVVLGPSLTPRAFLPVVLKQ